MQYASNKDISLGNFSIKKNCFDFIFTCIYVLLSRIGVTRFFFFILQQFAQAKFKKLCLADHAVQMVFFPGSVHDAQMVAPTSISSLSGDIS